MKKILSILLLVSMLLLSSCQLGTGGKATATGDVTWIPIFQCRQQVTGAVDDYYISVDPTCRGDSSYTDPIGYVSKEQIIGYNMQLISQCRREETIEVQKKTVFKAAVKRKFSDEYVTLGAKCERSQDKFLGQIGYIYKDQQPGTTQFYRCWMDRRTENVWDHWISRDENCYSGRLERNVKNEFSLGWIKTGAAPPVVTPILTDCEQLQKTNADLKTKIAATTQEISNLQTQIASVR